MPIPEAYVNNVGNLSKFLNEIRSAGVPERVTFEFLKTLGFKSSNDRPIITVLKGIGFLDQNGSPTEAYRAYRDHNQGPRVLANALKQTYSDIFLANTKAHELPVDKLKGIIATKISKGEGVVKLIAATFKTLAKAADFSDGPVVIPESAIAEDIELKQPNEEGPHLSHPAKAKMISGHGAALHYNIQIHFPTTTDVTVYNAIFKSLKEHLL
ncbi:MAG: hypothetical protein A2W23_09240 [Planctomycetes bacterium RBG_16_43_13]|nr:MAG: hypothetical protein A2W23_09240 [Planctomycetes bacterium RBG_16_43_13]